MFSGDYEELPRPLTLPPEPTLGHTYFPLRLFFFLRELIWHLGLVSRLEAWFLAGEGPQSNVKASVFPRKEPSVL